MLIGSMPSGPSSGGRVTSLKSCHSIRKICSSLYRKRRQFSNFIDTCPRGKSLAISNRYRIRRIDAEVRRLTSLATGGNSGQFRRNQRAAARATTQINMGRNDQFSDNVAHTGRGRNGVTLTINGALVAALAWNLVACVRAVAMVWLRVHARSSFCLATFRHSEPSAM